MGVRPKRKGERKKNIRRKKKTSRKVRSLPGGLVLGRRKKSALDKGRFQQATVHRQMLGGEKAGLQQGGGKPEKKWGARTFGKESSPVGVGEKKKKRVLLLKGGGAAIGCGGRQF